MIFNARVGGAASAGGDITTGLVGWWKFDENTGTTAFDSSGNSLNGGLGGSTIPTWVAPGKVGTSMLNFGGIGYVSVNYNSLLEPTAWTMTAWVRASSFPNGYNAVISKVSGYYYQLFVKSSGKLAVYVAGANGGVFYDGTGSITLSTATWYRLTVTYSAATGLIGYVNTSVDASAAAPGSWIGTGGGDLSIGNDLNTGGRLWNGDLDDVRFYNRALTAADIATLP